MKPYDTYKKHEKDLAAYFAQTSKNTFNYMVTGKKPSYVVESERREAEGKKRLAEILAKVKSCCHCGKQVSVMKGIDCGIDGGPSPCTVYGLEVRCVCGMSTKRYNYMGGDYDTPAPYGILAAAEACVAEWNAKK